MRVPMRKVPISVLVTVEPYRLWIKGPLCLLIQNPKPSLNMGGGRTGGFSRGAGGMWGGFEMGSMGMGGMGPTAYMGMGGYGTGATAGCGTGAAIGHGMGSTGGYGMGKHLLFSNKFLSFTSDLPFFTQCPHPPSPSFHAAPLQT